MKKQRSNVERVAHSFEHSICGLKAAYQDEIAFRLEIFFSVIAVVLALILDVSLIERIILISSWFLVLIIELLNSSIEAIVDRISLEIHPISKKIKDVGSAAVLLSIVNAVVIWGVIGIHHFLA